jgi:hypothetical protein
LKLPYCEDSPLQPPVIGSDFYFNFVSCHLSLLTYNI